MIFKDEVKIYDNMNNLQIISDEINFDLGDQTINSQSKSEIKDNLGNVYQVKQFEYNVENKIVKLIDLKVTDINLNTFEIMLAYLENKKELIAKDIDSF